MAELPAGDTDQVLTERSARRGHTMSGEHVPFSGHEIAAVHDADLKTHVHPGGWLVIEAHFSHAANPAGRWPPGRPAITRRVRS